MVKKKQFLIDPSIGSISFSIGSSGDGPSNQGRRG
jgi:hypothetical protein